MNKVSGSTSNIPLDRGTPHMSRGEFKPRQGFDLMPPLISFERCVEKKNQETGSELLKRLETASLAFE